MTTWFVDPEGGNDANAGTSFALRKKSFSAITHAAGDSVRLIADFGAQNLGNGTWTDASSTVTLAAAATLTLDNCDAAWTAAANITSTVSTGGMKQGTGAAQLAFASGFTTGLVAYKAVSNLNLSAYAAVSLWMFTSGTTMTQGLQLALCSDSAGATPLVTLPFPTWLVSHTLPFYAFPVLFENGGAALPSGVNSIAIYANSGKPFTGTVAIDNVIATLAYGAAGFISHGCMLGKNNGPEPEWYPIQSIDGTTVKVGNYQDNGTATPARNYRGTTETVTTYSMVPLRTRMSVAQSTLTGANGTAILPLSWTGGWDRTAMASQVGTSWLSGESIQSSGFNNTNGLAWMSHPDSTIGYTSYVGTAVYMGFSTGAAYHLAGIVNSLTPISSVVAAATYDLSMGNLVRNSGPSFSLAGMQSSKFKLRIRRITGVTGTGITVSDANDDANTDIAIGMIDNCTNAVQPTSNARMRIKGLTVQNNATNSIFPAAGNILLDRPILSDTNICTFAAGTGLTIRCTNVAGNAWDNRVYSYGVTQTMTQATVHGLAAQSLSLKLNDYQSYLGLPYLARIARVACFAGKTITFSAWMQRSTQFAYAGIMVQAGSVAGIVDAQAQGVAANTTWEQVTLNFTPTENGVVDVFAYITGQPSASGNGTIALFGDTSVSST